jgi:hypothetical protein
VPRLSDLQLMKHRHSGVDILRRIHVYGGR